MPRRWRGGRASGLQRQLADRAEKEIHDTTAILTELRTQILKELKLLETPRQFGMADDETLAGLPAASANDQQEVTDQLGYQVHRAVEALVQRWTPATRTARLLGSLHAKCTIADEEALLVSSANLTD